MDVGCISCRKYRGEETGHLRQLLWVLWQILAVDSAELEAWVCVCVRACVRAFVHSQIAQAVRLKQRNNSEAMLMHRRPCGVIVVAHMLALLGVCSSTMSANCRDRLKQPFSSTSIWNTAIGSGAVFVPANVYQAPDVPPGTDACTIGKQHPSARVGCPGWQPTWTEVRLLQNQKA